MAKKYFTYFLISVTIKIKENLKEQCILLRKQYPFFDVVIAVNPLEPLD
jgi:hypothetical protein